MNKLTHLVQGCRRPAALRCTIVHVAFAAAFLGAVGCGSNDNSNGDDQCTPGDQDGVNGGYDTVPVSVSDTAFSVGGVDSGSTEKNITVQNLAIVTLTLTNTGTKPHDMVVECIPTGLPATCMNPTSCFDDINDAGMASGGGITLIPTLQPGQSQTIVVQTPLVEGTYYFISDEPGDGTSFESDGGVTGSLVGDFVLM